eukprot:TRINITY_DN9132_c0_g1_i7.p2 TRINITY_DN9132_c0_g1~~TRINITY_DN9132_c0_g1_i7.p2  ORF type:complete len:188 (+),score=35.33 TRINITY_DN9132_c0_g1_i7:611-1174(+)
MRTVDLVARGGLCRGRGRNRGRVRAPLQRPAGHRRAGHLFARDDGSGRGARCRDRTHWRRRDDFGHLPDPVQHRPRGRDIKRIDKNRKMSSGQTLGVKAQRFRGHTSPHRNVRRCSEGIQHQGCRDHHLPGQWHGRLGSRDQQHTVTRRYGFDRALRHVQPSLDRPVRAARPECRDHRMRLGNRCAG